MELVVISIIGCSRVGRDMDVGSGEPSGLCSGESLVGSLLLEVSTAVETTLGSTYCRS